MCQEVSVGLTAVKACDTSCMPLGCSFGPWPAGMDWYTVAEAGDPTYDTAATQPNDCRAPDMIDTAVEHGLTESGTDGLGQRTATLRKILHGILHSTGMMNSPSADDLQSGPCLPVCPSIAYRTSSQRHAGPLRRAAGGGRPHTARGTWSNPPSHNFPPPVWWLAAGPGDVERMCAAHGLVWRLPEI